MILYLEKIVKRAGERSRTAVAALARQRNDRYTTPAYASTVCRGVESNHRPLLFQRSALPLSYRGMINILILAYLRPPDNVDGTGFEPVTPAM